MVYIIGAGLSGLIAANMLREQVGGIWERSNALPNNHNAILRFKSDIVSTTTNIPFKKVKVLKSVSYFSNPVADMMAYSYKVTGRYQSRSIITAGQEMVDRYIAPPDFIHKLEKRLHMDVTYGYGWKPKGRLFKPVISTIPMPHLMKLLEYPILNESEIDSLFTYREGYVIRGQLPNCNAYATVYVPDPSLPIYRISVTGDELYIECVGPLSDDKKIDHMEWLIDHAKHILGIIETSGTEIINPSIKKMQYAKINPIDDRLRKDFILWASERDVYSLGRFATWRPSLLLDDLINDVNIIARLIEGDKTPNYHIKLGENND